MSGIIRSWIDEIYEERQEASRKAAEVLRTHLAASNVQRCYIGPNCETMYECLLCAAVVKDWERHAAWHKLQATAPSPTEPKCDL